MSDRSPERAATPPSRTRRLVWMALAAVALPSLGVWLWNQRPAGDAPRRTPVAQVANTQEHGHTNRLIDETSPYLLQHAHNPVNWYPWGDEAFEKAKKEDKPIFLSVGYSTCYWCHVMEVESFETEEVAAILNEYFVAIKVDREERPDIDEQYMLATQLMHQRGGWPNSVWLTPAGKPWMAGTYFPKPQFIDALTQLAEIWRTRRADVDRQADALAQQIAQIGGGVPAGEGGELTPQRLDRAVTGLTDRFDPRNGGFGNAPKFPPHGTLRLLLRRYRDTQNPELLPPITRTLDAMWLGGMHDHVGGGFHRYSTDEHWLLPHFEKMLYDNAQLMRVYTDGYLATGHERYRLAVEDIFQWVRREMTSPDGAFYSAIDSGEVGKEGETYLWHVDEVREVLGPQDAALFIEIYNLQKHGNFTEEATGERPGTNIPHLKQPIDAIAQARGEDPDAFADRLARMRDKLLSRRQTWAQPHKDDKVLSGWNGLMIASLAYAGHRLDEPRYTQAATRAADFILHNMMRDGSLLRTYRADQAKQPAYLDDHAYFADALIELYHATGDRRWLDQAHALTQALMDGFFDGQNGGFYFTSATDHEDLLVRSRGLNSGGNIPDANGVAAQVLLRMTELTGEQRYADAARRTLRPMAAVIERSPYGLEHLLLAAADTFDQPPAAPADALAEKQDDDPPAPARAEPTPDPQTTSSADATGQLDAVKVRVYASRLAVQPGGTLELAVALDIDDGWHLYGENPDIDFLLPSSVAVQDAPGLSVGEVVAPKAHSLVDPFLKRPLNTYTGQVWFRVPVTIDESTQPGAVTLELTVKTQACNDNRCLAPQTTTLRVPVQIDPEASDATRHPGVFAASHAPPKPPSAPAQPAAPVGAAVAWRQFGEDVQRQLQTAADPDAVLVATLPELERFARTYAGTPEAAVALFNHGMLNRQLGDDEAAQRSLQRAAQQTDDPTLSRQIDMQLRLLKIRPGQTPPDFTAAALTGEPVSPKNFHGKVVLLDFWATWCAPCIAELPNMQRVYKDHHESGFEIVSISLDDTREPLTQFLDRRPLPWTHVFNAAVPMESSPAVVYGVVGIPHTVLIGRDGKIAALDLRGPALEEAVVKALAQPADDEPVRAREGGRESTASRERANTDQFPTP